MPFRTILCVLGSDQEAEDIGPAITLCERANAHLSVLIIGRAPPPPLVNYGGEGSAEAWGEALSEAARRAEKQEEVIEARLAGAGISSDVFATVAETGEVDRTVARRARYADVTVVMPRLPAGEFLRDRVLKGALFESGRPLVLLPAADTVFPAAKRVMVAWDAGLEAAKAVYASLPILEKAEDVHIVIVDPVSARNAHGAEPGADVSAYLARHGLKIAVERIPSGGKDVTTALLQHATDMQADLLVMGGYGHSRLRQRIFGGTTESVIADAALPVLMVH